MRWSEALGRVLERRVSAVGTGNPALAGWVKQCGLSRVAIYTPDRARLIVQRRRKKLDATGGVQVATLTHLGIVRVLRLVPNRGRPLHVWNFVWDEALVHLLDSPWDETFLEMVRRLSVEGRVPEVWQPDAAPPLSSPGVGE